MGVRKEAKDEIVRLMLQETPTEEIANIMGYSVGTVRKVFEELREELLKFNNHFKNILNLIDGRQNATSQKRRRGMRKNPKNDKKKKN